ncbi:hypothetical protein [Salinarimonas soli]|uniref:Uncharacterized protein n=1 Tax=Salinarimonas soli TaxID=1638099 RepID=A0A5B2VGL8_9HYPH|nr:hypothetical protein [Salinarimonas soli]KAA2237706.1 hypothetical protein F0L46_08485 [Salinarimonas soli]
MPDCDDAPPPRAPLQQVLADGTRRHTTHDGYLDLPAEPRLHADAVRINGVRHELDSDDHREGTSS